MGATAIEWTDFSSNPLRYRDAAGNDVWGCVKKSAGCQNCYSEARALRFHKGGPFTPATMRTLTPYVREKELEELLSPKKTPDGSKVFVGDMTDIFGDWVPFDLIDRLFAVFALRPDVIFQILTKRPNRMAEYVNGGAHLRMTRCMVNFREYTEPVGPWPLPNVWLGASVENQAAADERIPHLLKVPAKVRFLSCEPLLGPVEIKFPLDGYVRAEDGKWVGTGRGIQWVIAGGESGPGARPMHPAWARSLRDQCQAAVVAFHFKQWGEYSPTSSWDEYEIRNGTVAHANAPDGRGMRGVEAVRRVGKKRAGRLLDGRTWDEFPEAKS